MNTLNTGNIIGFLAISGIIITLLILYHWIKARAWLWFIAAWSYVLFVRGWIMFKNLWHDCPQYSFTLINTLMNVGYVFLFFGCLSVVISLREVMKNGKK
jgi:hypothetical protein